MKISFRDEDTNAHQFSKNLQPNSWKCFQTSARIYFNRNFDMLTISRRIRSYLSEFPFITEEFAEFAFEIADEVIQQSIRALLPHPLLVPYFLSSKQNDRETQ